ncbi:MAG: cytochrome c biogenesis protein CcdA [Nitrospirae bacterium]|nr:cytochrome c biogenesis protein CcdA [Nitrospirota bacterium]
MIDITYLGAFLGGLLSFFSPCVVPLIPSYVSYITGISFDEFETGDKALIRKLTFINSLAFISGFSLVYILLGVFSSFIGYILSAYYDAIRIVGGIVIIFFGLYVMGVFKVKSLSAEHRLHVKSKPRGYLGSFVIGLTFAAGWTPCIGPILGTILLYASTSGSVWYGFNLLVIYSAGLGIPFMITALAINTFLSNYGVIRKYMKVVLILSGLLLITFGVILLADEVTFLVRLAPDFTPKL